MSETKVRVEEMKNQTMDESSLLNLEFLEAELQTFIDGFIFKGFYFPIRFEIKIEEENK